MSESQPFSITSVFDKEYKGVVLRNRSDAFVLLSQIRLKKSLGTAEQMEQSKARLQNLSLNAVC
jgi:hypothetical protein